MDGPDCTRILKAMNKMIKLGTEPISPNLSNVGSRGGFIKVKGLSSQTAGVFQTGDKSKLKQILSEEQFKKRKKSRGQSFKTTSGVPTVFSKGLMP